MDDSDSMSRNERWVREQIAAARKYMSIEPTASDIRNMLDSSITETVDVEKLLEETRDDERSNSFK